MNCLYLLSLPTCLFFQVPPPQEVSEAINHLVEHHQHPHQHDLQLEGGGLKRLAEVEATLPRKILKQEEELPEFEEDFESYSSDKVSSCFDFSSKSNIITNENNSKGCLTAYRFITNQNTLSLPSIKSVLLKYQTVHCQFAITTPSPCFCTVLLSLVGEAIFFCPHRT